MIRFVKDLFQHLVSIKYGAHWEAKGDNVHIDYKTSIFNPYNHISLGHNIYIGPRALFYCSHSKIRIDSGVTIGPSLTIIAGDHNYKTVGKFIIDEKRKLPENDKDVLIESDVWIGCNVTILKGVTVHHGSIIAAGSVVVQDVPAYSIVGGNPAKVIGARFSQNVVPEHERILYGGPYDEMKIR